MDVGWLWSSLRMLEEGKVDESDKRKDEIEEYQRERRKALNKLGEEHVPRFFKWAFFSFSLFQFPSCMLLKAAMALLFRKSKDSCGRDIWITNETYWELRESPGFSHLEDPHLWWWDNADHDKRKMERNEEKILLISAHSWCTPMTGSWVHYP